MTKTVTLAPSTTRFIYSVKDKFDRVWHKGLLAKLHHFGVRSHALAWITNYLSERRQCVRLRNSTSSWLPVPAGVPQGSVLGPLLFLAYTIDLPNCVRHPTQCDQFADDTALTTVSSSPGVCEEHLQQSVTATSTWLSNWRLTVNVEKTVTMAFTRRPDCMILGRHFERVSVSTHLCDKCKILMADCELAFVSGLAARLFSRVRFHFWPPRRRYTCILFLSCNFQRSRSRQNSRARQRTDPLRPVNPKLEVAWPCIGLQRLCGGFVLVHLPTKGCIKN